MEPSQKDLEIKSLHSRPQSCNPFGQRHGCADHKDRGLWGRECSGGGQDNAQAQQLAIFVTNSNRYCFKFLWLCRKPKFLLSDPCQSSRSEALAKRIAVLATRMKSFNPRFAHAVQDHVPWFTIASLCSVCP